MDNKERKRQHRLEQKNRWMAHYEFKYGVQPIEFGAIQAIDGTPTVIKAKCRFCECFGREVSERDLQSDGLTTDSDGQIIKRRKKRQTLKVFGPNFRTDNLESHLTREHPIKWKEYDRLRDNEKRTFFPEGMTSSLKEPASLRNDHHHHLSLANTLGGLPPLSNGGSSSLGATTLLEKMIPEKYIVSANAMDMVEHLLSNRLLRTHPPSSISPNLTGSNGSSASWWNQYVRVEENLEELPLNAEFKLENTNEFSVLIQNEPVFRYVIHALANGLSFHAIPKMLQTTQSIVPESALLGSLTISDVLANLRKLVAVNLSCITQLLSYTWGFSLYMKFVTHHSTGFMDIRIQLPVNDIIQNLHLLSLPLDSQKHDAESVAQVVAKILTTLDENAMAKLVGISIDGDPYHMSKYTKLSDHLRKEVAGVTDNDTAFYVLHSGQYHLNGAMEDLLNVFEKEFKFISIMKELVTLCESQPQLLLMFGPKPVRQGDAHWISVYTLCEWLSIHREHIIKWFRDLDQSKRLPSNHWWVQVFLLRDMMKDMYSTYKKCGTSTNVADVQKYLRDIVFQLRIKFSMKSATEPLTTFDADSCEFQYQDFVNATIPLDLFMYEAFQLKTVEGVGETERNEIFKHFKTWLTEIISKILDGANFKGTDGITDQNGTMNNELPPATPIDYMTMNNVAFMEILKRQQFRVRAKWTGKVLSLITEDRNRMLSEFSQRDAFHQNLTNASKEGSFEATWKPAQVTFNQLYQFATVFGCLLSVPKDIASDAFHFTSCSSNFHVSNLALEAYLHSKQFEQIKSLRRHVESYV